MQVKLSLFNKLIDTWSSTYIESFEFNYLNLRNGIAIGKGVS